MLNVDQRIRMLIGEYTVQITALQAENEQLKAQLTEKACEVPAKEPDAPAAV